MRAFLWSILGCTAKQVNAWQAWNKSAHAEAVSFDLSLKESVVQKRSASGSARN
jgi:hypothetical protein